MNHHQGHQSLNPGCLSRIGQSDKLLLVGHGVPGGFEIEVVLHSPDDLGGFLVNHSLREVGLISFKSCSIGAEGFLIQFAFSLYGVRVGWLKAYIEDVYVKDPLSGYFVETEYQRGILIGRWPDKLENSLRVKILKGNIDTYPLESSPRYR